MEAVYAVTVGVLCACGLYLLLAARTLQVIFGIMLFCYAVNLFLLGMGRLTTGRPPMAGAGAGLADPVPQALVLTAIVIGFATTAFCVVLALRSLAMNGTDHVNGKEKRAQ